jgi:hypothetical protein
MKRKWTDKEVVDSGNEISGSTANRILSWLLKATRLFKLAETVCSKTLVTVFHTLLCHVPEYRNIVTEQNCHLYLPEDGGSTFNHIHASAGLHSNRPYSQESRNIGVRI